MARTQKLTKDLNAQAAAYLSAKHQLSQRDVGEHLGGISQSMVSRLLKRAEGLGWLQVEYRFVGEERLSPERLAQLRRLMEPKALLDVLKNVRSETGVLVRQVRVVDSGRRGTSPRAIDAGLRRVGRAAAARVVELLPQSEVFAVTWGKTVSNVVDGLAAAPPLHVTTRAIRFIPVCAEPLEQSSDADTSTHLARRLHAILKATTPPPPSLTGMPALIARRFRGADAQGIRKYVDRAASYREIFGARAPLIAKVDSLLTSVGQSAHPMGFIHDELLSAGSRPKKPLTSTSLAGLVAGDISGVLLPKPDLDRARRREVEALNAMWTGVKLKHLQRIAKEADRCKRPGVIVVSLGADRAEIIAEAVRCGLINELIVDRPLAEMLARTLSPARA